ncbi:MAG TPA: hypothetical protein PKC72_14980 [Chitinophagaceae bacterium]|nr:hypothetical protein [Chitinophagaceae bacterium]
MNSRSLYMWALIGYIVFLGCDNVKKNQYFTGTIEYDYSYSSDSLNIDSLKNARLGKGFFRYDISDYQSRFIGQDTTTYFYSGKTNKCVEESGRGKYECEDYGKASDSIISVKVYDTDEKVLDHSCGIIEIQKTRSRVQYYFAKDLKMAPAIYKLHRAYNWDVYGAKTNGGLVLKLKHQFKTFTMTGIATAIKEYNKEFKALQLDDGVFINTCKQIK